MRTDRICSIDGCQRTDIKAWGWCVLHYSRWRNHGSPLWIPEHEDGLGVCECDVSYPEPKCCRRCGYPSIYRMAPRTRLRALARQPHLAHQVIAEECAA